MRQVFSSMEGAIANLSLSWRRGDCAMLCWWVVPQRGLEGGDRPCGHGQLAFTLPRVCQCCGEHRCVMPGGPFHSEFINSAS